MDSDSLGLARLSSEHRVAAGVRGGEGNGVLTEWGSAWPISSASILRSVCSCILVMQAQLPLELVAASSIHIVPPRYTHLWLGLRGIFSYTCAKNYQNRAWFDNVVSKIKRCNFYGPPCIKRRYIRCVAVCGNRQPKRQGTGQSNLAKAALNDPRTVKPSWAAWQTDRRLRTLVPTVCISYIRCSLLISTGHFELPVSPN